MTVEERLHEVVARLAALERAPCSPGEREAADYVAGRLREHCGDVRVEEERVHGTFHWPLLGLSLMAVAGAVAAYRGRRATGFALAAASAASIYEDLGGGRRRWFRHRALPQGTTSNVVAEAGDRDAARTLVVLAHHDSAHTSFLFDDAGPRLIATRAPKLLARMDRWPPLMWLVAGGPLLVAWGALTGDRGILRAGAVSSAGTAAVMADLATNAVVPGANDNATAVALLVELARDLAERPVTGVRVLLVSAGSEEANQEGIIAFMQRHQAALDPAATSFLCVDTVGSPSLILIEGEGFLVMRDYPAAFKQRVADAAGAVGVPLRRGLKFSFATDGLIPMRAGYPTASVASLNEYMVPSNYHWPTDTADRVDYGTVADAVRVTRQLVDDLAD